jgi:glycosyltransferase involved in cell wall biosynthesis
VKILLAVSRWPWPPRRGDQMRALQVAGALAEEHRVTLLAPEPPAIAAEDPGGEAAAAPPAGLPFRLETYAVRRRAAASGLLRAAVAGRPLQSGLFHQPHLAARLRELAPAADLAVLQLVRLATHAGDLGATPFVVDLVDSLALNFERRARFDLPWHRPLLALEARRLLAAETALLRRAAGGWLVSERDRAWLAARLPPPVAARLAVVPLQVPQRVAGASGGPAAPPRLVLTGNLGYFPTADAAAWWVRDVWPALRAARPELGLTLAGARPAPAVRRAARAPGVELLDTPRSLDPILAAASVALAPLRAGSGVPVKVLEAWAAGVPVVATPWAAAGAAARPGFELLVAGNPDEWRESVLRLLDDPALAGRLAAAGRARLAAGHSAAALRSVLRTAIADARGSAPP